MTAAERPSWGQAAPPGGSPAPQRTSALPSAPPIGDAGILRAAAAVLRGRAVRQTFLLRVFTGVLDKRAARIERSG